MKDTRDAMMQHICTECSKVMTEEQVSDIMDKIKSTQNKYSAKTNLASAIFYVKVDTFITDGKHFSGNGGGLLTPGGGIIFGDLYTEDLDKLYKKTVSFQLSVTNVFCSVLFFDEYSTLLGHFEGGGVSTVAGIAGGTGAWS